MCDAIAIIPARGGSKGIIDKNITFVGGRPLIAYTLTAAEESGVAERVIVSSDSDRILRVARNLGAEILVRPAELATDIASSDDVIAHALQALGVISHTERPVILLQPTSPLRTAAHIANAMALWRDNRPRCVVSVFEPREHPAKSFRIGEDGYMTGLFGADAPFTPRQALLPAYMPNGAIYIFSVAAFLDENRIPRTGLLPFIMDSKSSIDIDCMDDLAEVERQMQGF